MDTAAPLTIVVAGGQWGTVECAVRNNGEVPAKTFLEDDCEEIREKGKDDPQATARARFLLLFQQMANYGRIAPKRFKKEMGRFWAFRHKVRNIQIRFPCFQDGPRWILTHGFPKKGDDWPQNQITKATDIASEYDLRKKQLGSNVRRDKL